MVCLLKLSLSYFYNYQLKDWSQKEKQQWGLLDYKLEMKTIAFFSFFLSCYPFSFKQNIPLFLTPGTTLGKWLQVLNRRDWGGGGMSHSCRKQGDSNPAKPEGKGRFFYFAKSRHLTCV